MALFRFYFFCLVVILAISYSSTAKTTVKVTTAKPKTTKSTVKPTTTKKTARPTTAKPTAKPGTKKPTVCTSGTFKKANGQNVCYFMVPGALSYEEGKSVCISHRARLPEVMSASENANIQKIKGDNPTNEWGGVWLGLNDLVNQGTFVWESDNSIPNYTNWSPGNPDNYGGFQHCGVMRNGGTWDDAHCLVNDPDYKTMCEMILG